MPALAGSGVAIAASAARRFWELDLARAVAIAMMVSYHVVYDVDLLAPGLGPDPFRGSWGLLPEATGSLFLLVAGVSLALSDGRLRARGVDARGRMARHARRAGTILAAAMLVSLATWIVFPERYVRFGILHAIGVALLLGAATARLRLWNLLLGAAVVAAGLLLAGAQSDAPGLVVLGIRPPGFSSVDYWPLLPWAGVFLAGIAVGAALYPGGSRSRLLGRLPATAPALELATAPARRSLLVYLLHQLILIPLIWALLVAVGAEASWPS